MNRLLAALALIMAGVCVAGVARAQSTSNQLTMNQWVHLAQDGSLTGRVLLANAKGQASIPAAATVLVRDNNGSTFQGQTDSEGKFKFNSLKPGIYTLIAKGQNAFASVALHVLPVDDALGYGFPSVVEISAAKIHDSTVKMAIARYLPPNLQNPNASLGNADLKNLASHVYGNELSQVVQIDGGMKGRIFRAGAIGTELQTAQRTNVFLFQNGLEVARGLTDESGRFEIDQLAVGHYSMLAIGRQGIGSIGFVLVDEAQAKETAQLKSTNQDTETLVMQYGCCGVQQEFAMQIAPGPAAMELVQGLIIQDIACGCGAAVPVPACGCSVLVDPCGCGGVVTEGAVADGSIVEGETIDGEPIADAGGGAIAPGGYAGYSGGSGGFGGGGGGGGGGGLGGLGALGGLGGVLAAAGGSGGGGSISTPISPPVIVSPSSPTENPDAAL
jgi:hypothetical protein